jgi:hypothetical protein
VQVEARLQSHNSRHQGRAIRAPQAAAGKTPGRRKMMNCDICGNYCTHLFAQGVFTVKVYTFEAIRPYRYRIRPDPETLHICDACWKKQMRSLAEQLCKAEKPIRYREG